MGHETENGSISEIAKLCYSDFSVKISDRVADPVAKLTKRHW